MHTHSRRRGCMRLRARLTTTETVYPPRVSGVQVQAWQALLPVPWVAWRCSPPLCSSPSSPRPPPSSSRASSSTAVHARYSPPGSAAAARTRHTHPPRPPSRSCRRSPGPHQHHRHCIRSPQAPSQAARRRLWCHHHHQSHSRMRLTRSAISPRPLSRLTPPEPSWLSSR